MKPKRFLDTTADSLGSVSLRSKEIYSSTRTSNMMSINFVIEKLMEWKARVTWKALDGDQMDTGSRPVLKWPSGSQKPKLGDLVLELLKLLKVTHHNGTMINATMAPETKQHALQWLAMDRHFLLGLRRAKVKAVWPLRSIG